MNRAHFEQLQPFCPACQTADSTADVELLGVEVENGEHVVEGWLGCTNEQCQHEYPIIDGIPILLPQARQFICDNAFAILRRRDLSESVEGMVGDCCGPDAPLDRIRQHASCYGWSHYACRDPEESDDVASQSLERLLEQILARSGPIAGPVLDAGCAVGGASFALARRTGALTLGVDVHFSLLRIAAAAARSGVVEYPRRRSGVIYERRTFELCEPNRDKTDFWASDATGLPVRAETFSTAVGLHTLDSVASPVGLLTEMTRVLAPGGKLIFACPYDWTGAVTPVESWLGGHSARGHRHGDSASILIDLLTEGAHPASVVGLRVTHESDDLIWKVRWHERATIDYRIHLVVAEKLAGTS